MNVLIDENTLKDIADSVRSASGSSEKMLMRNVSDKIKEIANDKYQSGYNSGIEYADGRANTGSTNYKTGYDAGVTATKKGTATAENVLTGKTFTNSNDVNMEGTMTNNGTKTASLNCGESYTILEGYHSGSGKVTANSLASQTDGTATASDILLNKTAYVNGVKLTGSMKSNPAGDTELVCGQVYSIPSGYHTGGGRLIVATLAEQTEATALATDIAEGKTAWVNGTEIIGTAQQVPNGKAWTQSNITSGNFVSFGCLDKVFVAGSDGSGLYYSEDGITWTQSNVTSGTFKSLCHNSDNIWIAGDCSDSALGIYESRDGKTWIQKMPGVCQDVKFANGIWVAAFSGSGATGLYYSTTSGSGGTSWTQYYSGKVTVNCFSVCYGNGIWVASSSEGKYYSTDGKAWTKADNVTGFFDTILYGNGVFVAIKKESTSWAYSVDGKTWACPSGVISYNINFICYGNGSWVIGTGTARYYSADGKAWKASYANSYLSCHYANGLFIMGLGGGSIQYSNNGNSWSSGKSVTGGGITHIYYARGIWVASNGNGIYYSKAF